MHSSENSKFSPAVGIYYGWYTPRHIYGLTLSAYRNSCRWIWWWFYVWFVKLQLSPKKPHKHIFPKEPQDLWTTLSYVNTFSWHSKTKFKMSFRGFRCKKVIISTTTKRTEWGRKYLIKWLYWNYFRNEPWICIFTRETNHLRVMQIYVNMFYCAPGARANDIQIIPNSKVPMNQTTTDIWIYNKN